MPAKRNPLKPLNPKRAAARIKPLASITGKGEEFATGEGGGVLRFLDGELVATLPVPLMKQWTAEESALLIRASGQMNIPLESIPASDLSTLAAAVIQAMHQGDARMLERLAKIAAGTGAFNAGCKESQIDSVLSDAVRAAATLAHQPPTWAEVCDAVAHACENAEVKSIVPTSYRSTNTLERLLKRIGFQWLPKRSRGRPRTC